MATLERKDKGYRIKFSLNGVRASLFLGSKYKPKTAAELKEIIKTLIACRDNNQQPDKRVVAYLATAPPEIRDKLEKTGLIAQAKIQTLGQLWDAFEAEHLGSLKDSTKRIYGQTRSKFFMLFEKDGQIDKVAFFKESDLISKVTKTTLLEWKTRLAKTYAKATITITVAQTKCLFNWATDEKDLFVKSPTKGVKKESSVNKDRTFEVKMADYEKILAACRTQEQRAILTLARIGGLRIPSEMANLKWDDITWPSPDNGEIGRIWIKSPKTEHHEGQEGRFVPLWPQIHKELEALYFADDADGSDDRVFRNREATSNLRTRFEKIQIRAGIVPIVKFFTNCRASRSTEVFDKYGAICESAWIGHSQAVARRHYYVVKDADYRAATLEFGSSSSNSPRDEIGDTFSGAKPESPVFCSATSPKIGDTIGGC